MKYLAAFRPISVATSFSSFRTCPLPTSWLVPILEIGSHGFGLCMRFARCIHARLARAQHGVFSSKLNTESHSYQIGCSTQDNSNHGCTLCLAKLFLLTVEVCISKYFYSPHTFKTLVKINSQSEADTKLAGSLIGPDIAD
jgi:hypothetical protein